MKRIGLLSDTHGWVNPRIYEFFAGCDEIWHAGDFGSIDVADELSRFRPLRGVYGNIDDCVVRSQYKRFEVFTTEGFKVLLTHIGGYPDHYTAETKALLAEVKPTLFVCGHSHILKVISDRKLNLLHLNPGAAGNSGFHKKITMLRFELDNGVIRNMEIFESDRKISVED